jgi:hypothetical protein
MARCARRQLDSWTQQRNSFQVVTKFDRYSGGKRRSKWVTWAKRGAVVGVIALIALAKWYAQPTPPPRRAPADRA